VEHENPFVCVRRKMVVARIEFMGCLAAFNREQLSSTVTEEGHSPLQIAHHLYLVDGLVAQQIHRVQEEDDPVLINPIELPADYCPAASVESVPDSTAFTLEAILSGMAARREEIFTYLAALPALAWERTFHFAEPAPLCFYQLINLLSLHDQQHACQLTTMKARLDALSE
jgi:DinB superfamily